MYELILSIYVFFIGTIFWSFWSVLVERIHSGKKGIVLGRSECPLCKHTLSWYELFPIFSWIFLGWKCKKCKASIHWFYPFIEIITGWTFLVLFTKFLPIIDSIFWIALLLFITFLLIVVMVYDIKYMEIPDKIMIPVLFLTVLILCFESFWNLFYTLSGETLYQHMLWGVILYTFFYLQIFLPESYHALLEKKWKYLWELIITYILFPISIVYWYFFPGKNASDDEEMEYAWIGWWDLRLALFLWLSLGITGWIAAIIISYIIGSIFWIGILLIHKKRNIRIPFWPFLVIGWILAILFHESINSYFINYIYI